MRFAETFSARRIFILDASYLRVAVLRNVRRRSNYMSNKIFLRNYRATDLETIFRLDQLCFSERFRFDRESMREFVEAPGAITLIAEDVDGELVGCSITHLEETANGMRAYVVTLDVALESRRNGVAGKLMEESERRVATAGATRTELHVFVKNEEAIRFYEGRGYLRLRLRADFYGDGVDAWVYRKDLE
jgi:ribosomal-protein-alanine N-acetyltransferase